MKRFLLFITMLLPLTFFGQVQIGSDIDGSAPSSFSGTTTSLSSDGSIVAIGAPFYSELYYNGGQVRVYKNISNNWQQLGSDITGTLQDKVGYSVSISSDGFTLATGAPGNADNGYNSGQVIIYQYNTVNQDWIQLGNPINGENPSDFSGASVNLSSDGQSIAIGATFNNENGSESGQVVIYRFNNSINDWEKTGNDINGSAYDKLGTSVSLSSDGNSVAIGAPQNATEGYVSVYTYDSGNDVWNLLGNSIIGEAVGDLFGTSVSLSEYGTIVAIGAPDNDGSSNGAGHVRIYQLNSSANTWNLLGTDIDGESSGDASGSSVSLSSNGNIVAIGAPSNYGSNPINSNVGHTRIYSYNSVTNIWVQLGNDIDGERTNDYSGRPRTVCLSADGTAVSIGAPGNDGDNTNNDTDERGHVRVYDLSGAVLSSNSEVLEAFSLYPNPATSQAIITLPQNLNLKCVNIYNAIGQKIETINSTSINISALAKGIYYIEVVTNQGKATKKLIKQ